MTAGPRERGEQLLGRAREMLAGFTLGQRAIVAVAAVGIVLGAIALGRWAAQPTWSPLFTGLSGADASAITTELKAENVTYQLANDGTTILVPQAQVAAVRIAVAGKGLGPATTGSESSWSVLDKQGMTTTDFQQNVAYQRAVEGELARTLQAITGVNTAIVHLAIPKKDVFTSETDKPTASVLLSLAPGTTLTRSQISSVMHLVANSVPGLDASEVTISDQGGNQLSVREDGAAGAASAASETDQQTQAFEDARTAKLQKMLDSVLGKGKAVVRVNAELNFDASTTTAKSFSTASGGAPTLALATSSESYNQIGGGNGGLMGVTYPSLSPGGVAAGGGTYAKGVATLDYGVDQVVSETKASPGSIKKLSVAVVIDSNAEGVDIAKVTNLVRDAAGLQTVAAAGATPRDTLTVDTLAFDPTASAAAKKELADAESAAKQAQYLDLGKKAGVVLLAVVIAFLAFRRRKKDQDEATVEAVASDLPGGPTMLPAGATVEEQLALSAAAMDALETDGLDILDPTLERERLRDEVAMFVDNQPEEIAAMIQGWLGQRKT